MYFCPKCNYSFDISKSSLSNDDNDKILIKKINEIINLYETNEDLTKYKVEFTLEDLEKNVKYKKLNSTEKEKFNVLFQKNNLVIAQFKCNNCNYMKDINESILLYEYDITNNQTKLKNLEDNELMSKNPILPRTRDYNCKNLNCNSLKDKKINKEAVFFRDNETFKINYICCICYHNW
jgi:hypothetical protein